jgi:hypothetical protein
VKEIDYRDEFINVYLNHKPITTLGQVKRLYLTLTVPNSKYSEEKTASLLSEAIKTGEIPSEDLC